MTSSAPAIARWTILTLILACVGCATSSGATGPKARGYLRFEVQPEDAEIEIDEQYSGAVDGWVHQVVPVQPGVRKVTLRADGYITQRFDIEVAANEEVTLQLRMEPQLDLEPVREEPGHDLRRRLRPRLGARQ